MPTKVNPTKLKYPLHLMAVGAMLTFKPEQAQAARQACHNYGNRHNMYFRSKRKLGYGQGPCEIVITRVA